MEMGNMKRNLKKKGRERAMLVMKKEKDGVTNEYLYKIYSDEEKYDKKINFTFRLLQQNEVRSNQKDVYFWHLWYQSIKGTSDIEMVMKKILILRGTWKRMTE
ncbi:hypothetical protein ACLOJK_027524, partial [Asimina triloba]